MCVDFCRHYISQLTIISLLFTATVIVRAENRLPFGREKIVVHGNGSSGPYRIVKRIIGGTITIEQSAFTDSLIVSSWDIIEESITFNRPIDKGDSVTVIYTAVPEWLKKSYTRSSYGSQPIQRTQSSGGSYRDRTPKAFPGLSFGGSKTFEVSTGTDKSVALNQTLRLNISGKITDDISLNAVISDQNIPITPEGDTRELSELDRVLIELRGKNFSADMGDTDLKRSTGRWQTYSRRLSGAHLKVNHDNITVFGSGAVSEGRYMSTTINPVEGNQGPYRLIASNGSTHISIIPGTERLWINGEQLTRGYNYDYTIDYSTGEILFSESRIIGSDMRIVVDYEYTSDSYRRTFFSGGTDSEFLDGRLKIGIVATREADDPDRPIYGELDEFSRQALSDAGDSLASVNGIRVADGDTTGTYNIVDNHLVFNELGKGTHNATFSWMGENQGSYRYRGGGIYEFVAPENRGPGSDANYDPVAVVKGPVAHTLAGINVSLDPLSSFHIESEFAESSLDQNTLSGLDDSDNNGGAYRFEAKLSPEIDAGIPLKLEIGGQHRAMGNTFLPIDRDRTAEENRSWGLPLITEQNRETISEFTGGVSIKEGRFAGSALLFNGGQAEFGDSTVSSRVGGESRFMMGNMGQTRFSVNHIIRENFAGLPDETIDRFFGEGSTVFSDFRPSFIYEGEQVNGREDFTHSTAYDDIKLRLSNPEMLGVTSKTEWLYRIERAKHTSWKDSSTVKGGSIEMSAGSGSSGSIRTRYAHRERTAMSQSSTSDQALIEGYLRPAGGSTHIEATYRAGRSREASKRKNYIYTGGDRGSYRWEDENGDGVRDPDEFIPDEHGSYYLYEETLSDYIPVNSVHLFSRFNTDIPAGLIMALDRKKLKIRSETSFEVEETSTASASDVFFLKLNQFRKRGVTTSGESRIQEDVTIPVIGGEGSVRLRLFRLDSYNAEFVSGAERKGTDEQSLRLRMPVSEKGDTEITLIRAVQKRTMEQTSSGDFLVKSITGDIGISYYPMPAITVGINVGAGMDRDSVTGIEADYYSLKPAYIYRFSGRGKIDLVYTLTSVTLKNTGAGKRLPYTMAQGRKEGENHDVSVQYDYRLSNRINFVATYTGRKFAGRDFENFAQAQIRTIF
ncbi:MAG: hypothetical protein JXB48_16320 [Candidatus Latescibacteria bacterium]|nr:hypothetical protein [Candidatus Latescibacterota bacterium]